MPRRFAQLTFTESVKAVQTHYGTRAHNERYAASEVSNTELGEREQDFIAARDSFYLATVNENGWPYVQHRGGDVGFLRVLDASTLRFADLRGNLQYQSVGNLAHNDKLALILVDYPQRRRLKILGHAQVMDTAAKRDVGIGESERMVTIKVAGFDWNCSRHITPRFSEHEVHNIIEPLQHRLAILEEQLLQYQCGLP